MRTALFEDSSSAEALVEIYKLAFDLTMKTLQCFLRLVLLLDVLGCAAFGAGGRVFVSTPVSNHPKKTVAECMSPANHVLKAGMTVDETMSLLLNNGLSGAPVVNDFHEVVGIVTSYDIIQREAYEGALLPMDGTAENVNRYVDCAKKICGRKVEDIMTPDPSTVSSKTPMRLAASLMMQNKLHHLPVLDDASGKLVGVLTAADVMKDLLHIVRNLPAADDAVDNLT